MFIESNSRRFLIMQFISLCSLFITDLLFNESGIYSYRSLATFQTYT